MNDELLAKELRRRKAVVVHFSHHANMRAGGTFALADVFAAFPGRPVFTLGDDSLVELK